MKVLDAFRPREWKSPEKKEDQEEEKKEYDCPFQEKGAAVTRIHFCQDDVALPDSPLPQALATRFEVTQEQLAKGQPFVKPRAPTERNYAFYYLMEESLMLITEWEEVPKWDKMFEVVNPMMSACADESFWKAHYARSVSIGEIIIYNLMVAAWNHAKVNCEDLIWPGVPFKQASYPDFVIQTGDTQEKVHACILSVYAPALLSAGFKEGEAMKIVLDDVNPRTMRAVIDHMYEGYINQAEWFDIDGILMFADKYNLIPLQIAVAEFYVDALEDFKGIYEYAHAYNFHFLARAIVRSCIGDFEGVQYNKESFEGALLEHAMKKQRIT